MAGRAIKAPLAIAHEIANGIDFILNIMNTSPSRISLKVVNTFASGIRPLLFAALRKTIPDRPVTARTASSTAVFLLSRSDRTNALNKHRMKIKCY
jgi:hypothetical protein